jgi:glycosyltransferase involved in cell wall biosynthesis
MAFITKKIKSFLRLLIFGRWTSIKVASKQNIKHFTEKKLSPEDINPNHILILTTDQTLFIAALIEKYLIKNNYYVTIAKNYFPKADVNQLCFAICPQRFSHLNNYISFQMEQSIHPRWFTPGYFSILEKSKMIFDYSIVNVKYLLANGISGEKLHYLPIGSYPFYPEYLKSKGYNIEGKKSIDVLFYGDFNCERRQIFFKKLKSKFNVYIATEVYGEKLFKRIRQAKIVINIHYYENALLETTRLYETLSLGTPIVSEESIDLKEHEKLKKIIDFTPFGDVDAMSEKIEKLLTDKKYYSNRKESIKQFVRDDKSFEHLFEKYIHSGQIPDIVSYLHESESGK